MSDLEIQIYRLCHQDFLGLSQEEAAERAGISQSQVSRILAKIEKEHPELFPILNARQNYIYKRIVKHGDTHQAIAVMMNVTIRTVERITAQMKRKGVCFNSPMKTVPYKEYLDEQVKHKY